MIPKIIHYCWVGGAPYPKQIKDCMATWKKVLRGYEFIRWDESNFEISCNKYTEQAYARGKWAFVSDYIRLWALYNYGGIYLDTDVRVLKPFDRFLTHGFFSGYENKRLLEKIPTCTMGAEKGHPFIKLLLDDYNDRLFIKEDGSCDLKTNVSSITEIAKKAYGFIGDGKYQIFGENIHIYPYDFFSGFKGGLSNKIYQVNYEGNYDITSNTHTVHEFAGSWVKPSLIKTAVRRGCTFLRRAIANCPKRDKS